MKPLHSPTAAEFREQRLRYGVSQSVLAQLLGLHVNPVKNIENHRTKCSPHLWYFTKSRLNERDEEIRKRIAEFCRRWNSKVNR